MYALFFISATIAQSARRVTLDRTIDSSNHAVCIKLFIKSKEDLLANGQVLKVREFESPFIPFISFILPSFLKRVKY